MAENALWVMLNGTEYLDAWPAMSMGLVPGTTVLAPPHVYSDGDVGGVGATAFVGGVSLAGRTPVNAPVNARRRQRACHSHELVWTHSKPLRLVWTHGPKTSASTEKGTIPHACVHAPVNTRPRVHQPPCERIDL